MSENISKTTAPNATVINLAERRNEKLTPAALRRAKRASLWQPPVWPAYDCHISNINTLYQAFSGYLLHLQAKGVIKDFSLTPEPLEEQNADGSFWNRRAQLRLGTTTADLVFCSSRRPKSKTDADDDYKEFMIEQVVMRIDINEVCHWAYAKKIKGVPQINNPALWQVGVIPARKESITSMHDFLAGLQQGRHAPAIQSPSPEEAVRGGPLGQIRGRNDGRHLRLLALTPAAATAAEEYAPTKSQPKKHRIKTTAKPLATIKRSATGQKMLQQTIADPKKKKTKPNAQAAVEKATTPKTRRGTGIKKPVRKNLARRRTRREPKP